LSPDLYSDITSKDSKLFVIETKLSPEDLKKLPGKTKKEKRIHSVFIATSFILQFFDIDYLVKLTNKKNRGEMFKLPKRFLKDWKHILRIEQRIIIYAELRTCKPVIIARVMFEDDDDKFRFIDWLNPHQLCHQGEKLPSYLLSNLCFLGSRRKIRLGEGQRYESVETTLPPLTNMANTWDIKYRVSNDSKRCVIGACANLMHVLGCVEEYNEIIRLPVDTDTQAYNMCRDYFREKQDNFFILSLYLGEEKRPVEYVDDLAFITHVDSTYRLPMVICLKGKNDKADLHAVGIMNGQIFDGLEEVTYPLSKINLDHAMGGIDGVVAIPKGFLINPRKHIKRRFYEKWNLPDKSVFNDSTYQLTGEAIQRKRKRDEGDYIKY
jgi:hypothetical protein